MKDLVGSGSEVRETTRVIRRETTRPRTTPIAPPTSPLISAWRSLSSASRITIAIKKPRPAAGSPWKLNGCRVKQSPTEVAVSARRMTQKSHSWPRTPRNFELESEDPERGLPACPDPGPFIRPHGTAYDQPLREAWEQRRQPEERALPAGAGYVMDCILLN